jgi:hypothetical protein
MSYQLKTNEKSITHLEKHENKTKWFRTKSKEKKNIEKMKNKYTLKKRRVFMIGKEEMAYDDEIEPYEYKELYTQRNMLYNNYW